MDKKKPAAKNPTPKKKAAPKKKVTKKAEAKPQDTNTKDAVISPAEARKREGGRFWLGNQIWKQRAKHGREKIFKTPDLLWQAACEYFEWCDKNPLIEVDYKGGFATKVDIPRPRAYTMQGLCLYLGCNTGYFNDFEKGLKGSKDKQAAEFSTIVTRIRETVFAQKFEGAAAGLFNSNIIARELGLADKKEVENKTIVVETSEDEDE